MDEKKYYHSRYLVEISKQGYHKAKIDFFIHHLGSIENTKNKIEILDIASNDGLLAIQYSKYGNVTANEINEEGVFLCKEKGLKCLNGDFFDISEDYNGKFDVVIAGDIIEHIFDTDAFLEKVYLLLKKGGVLLLTTPNLASLGRRIMLLFGYNPFIEFSTKLPFEKYNVGHIRYYTKDNLKNQLKINNFRDINILGDRINFFGISKEIINMFLFPLLC